MIARCIAILAFLVLALLNTSASFAKTFTIGLDLSGSSPLSVPVFAEAAAGRLHAEVVKLQPGDFVYMRTIGDRGFANIPFKKIRIDRRNRAIDVAKRIADYIAALPSKPMEAQGSTNLLAFLMYGRDFGCAAGGGTIWLITDGIEHSELMTSKALLSGGSLPPPPKPKYLAGCSLTMDGFGANSGGNLPLAAIDKAQAAWEAYSKLAGVSAFDPIRP